MENMQKQLSRFITETQKSQQVISQLSKLYIILHQNVRRTIVKCTLDLAFDPTQDCQKHLNTILDLIQRLNDPNDSYLQGVDQLMLNKYQQQIYDLSQQVQKLLQTHSQVKSIDVKQLQAIKHTNNKELFTLKDELKRSDKRRLQSRSGRKHSQLNSHRDSPHCQDLLQKFSQYKKIFIEKKQKLQREMQGHIEKKSNQIIFAKKYNGKNLQEYFNLRRDVLNLQIADQFTKRIVEDHQETPKKFQSNQNSEGVQNKFFPFFKIKTKFMKNQVKQNILKALADVKIQLLEQYHLTNLKKLSEGNPDTLINLVENKKNTLSTNFKSRSQSKSTSNLKERGKKSIDFRTSRQTSVTRYPMAHKSCKPLIYSNGWSEEVEDSHCKTLCHRLLEGKVPNAI